MCVNGNWIIFSTNQTTRKKRKKDRMRFPVVAITLIVCNYLSIALGLILPSHRTTQQQHVIRHSFHPNFSQPPFYTSVLHLSTAPLGLPTSSSSSFLDKVKYGMDHLMKRFQNEEAMKWRVLAMSFFSSLFFFRNAIDMKLVTLWTYLTTSSSWMARIFRTDSYEWVLAVSAFFVYIHFFWYADVSVRKASEQGKIHPWRKYRLQDRFEADKHRRSMERKLQKTTRESSLQQNTDLDVEYRQVTKQTGWNWKAWTCEVWVYVVPLLTWDILSPRRHRRLAAFGAPTTIQILRDITCGLLLYDILFFTGHILMHKIPFLYRTVHAKHHQEPEVRAGDVVRLSMVEEVLEVGFSIIALNAMGAHPISRSIYNLIITFLLTELHCGFDFPWTPQNVVPFGLATGSRRHHYHHRNGKHYYQKFFFHVDRLFGFFQKDDKSLHGDSVKSNPHIPLAWQ